MLDGVARRLIDKPLNRAGTALAARGWQADHVTLAGLALGLLAAGLIWTGWPLIALAFLLASRIADGLDGAVARATTKTDFGGYLDICADFAFYAAIPLAFVLADPAQNGAAGAFLLATFYINGSTFLGYAVLAERAKMQTTSRGAKTLYFTGGLLEGTETIVFFCALCLLPHLFTPLAWAFGGLCLVTAISRVLLARQTFSGEETQ
ncbi:CDP-alcohol phosphatidyltransferase family protein [Vannielia litorea]|uniref:CDP-alcohol phosphatidyltransferase family protein n=1 Tax=Vannielia litorea TaxID=1217970 RepID=UPI001C939FA5|nr:CDP-alcohol phosphatidyltransferase family protein [Vannielia litorea]MBY6047085.1 CDP-alcohol phosphatidyltransferase family protein [Vannielia litorea]MBY6074499.1 CDP-alcohol phosphatidyltransferase family protein [Vannielia litorea]